MHHTIFLVKGMKLCEFGQPLMFVSHFSNHIIARIIDYLLITITQVFLYVTICWIRTYVTGTVRVNRKGMPSQVKTKQKMKGDLIAVHSGQLLSTSWMDLKQVRMLSTSSTAAPVELTRHKQTRTI